MMPFVTMSLALPKIRSEKFRANPGGDGGLRRLIRVPTRCRGRLLSETYALPDQPYALDHA